jgi:hypothetical protein
METPAPPLGETAQPLVVSSGAPIAAGGTAAEPLVDRRITAGAVLGLAPNTVLALTTDDVLHAVDLRSGRDRWTFVTQATFPALAWSPTRVFVPIDRTSADHTTAVLDLRSGTRIAMIPAFGGHVLGSTFYTKTPGGFTSYDATTARRLWTSAGGGGGLGQAPVQIGDLVFQDFYDSGAISLDDLDAFDVRTGNARFGAGYGPHPLGVGNGVVYVDGTWPPQLLQGLVSLTVNTLRLRDGARLHSFDYRPDPDRHAALNGPAISAHDVHVAGGYVYFTVEGDDYRYALDTPVAQADPTRIPDLRIVDAFGDTVLASGSSFVALARAEPDRLVLHRIANGPLLAGPVTRADGTRLLVVGDTLLAVAHDGMHVRNVGHIACPDPHDIQLWPHEIAVDCTDVVRNGSHRVLVFVDDVPLAAVALPTPRAAPAPRFIAHVIGRALAPPTSFPPQWEEGPIAALPDGSVVISLQHAGTGNTRATLRRIARDGSTSDLTLPLDAQPVSPTALIADAAGRLWYTDRDNPAIVRSRDAGGGVQAYTVGDNAPHIEPIPENASIDQRRRRFPRVTPVRIALGPDGTVWFAHSHPRPEIGRVTGGPRIPIPENAGPALQLVGGSDALWFLTPTTIGRVTPNGQLTTMPVPAASLRKYGPYGTLVPSPHGTVWLLDRASLTEFDATHALRTLTLSNATVALTTGTFGCDGVLYAGETTTLLARVDAHGLTEIPIDLAWVDPQVPDRDCNLWYVNPYANAGKSIGTIAIAPGGG